MAVPDYQSLMKPLLECAKKGQEVKTNQCAEIIAERLFLSDEDKEEMLPSGRQSLLSNRVHWARTYLAKANLIEATKRGHFKITARGKDVLLSNPGIINIKFLNNYEEFRQWRDVDSRKNIEIQNSDTGFEEEQSPEEKMETAALELELQLRKEILSNLYDVTPTMFEQIIVDLLIAMGYGGGRAEMGRALGKTNDGGVDGVVKEDELGLDVVYIQAKRYKAENPIGRPDVQSFVGSLEGFNATKGVFVTTSSFANTVEEYVAKIHKRIVLIDGKRMASLMIRHNVGVRVKETYSLKSLDEDYFS